MAFRMKPLVIAAVAVALLASAAMAYDHKIWVSVDGNAPPDGYNPDYETTTVTDAIDYINSQKNIDGIIPLTDSVEVWIDAGEYLEWNGYFWSGFNRICNLYIHGYSSNPEETVINAGYHTQNNVTYEDHALMFYDIHNGRVEDLTIKGARIGDLIDPAKKRAWYSRDNYVEIDPGGATWSVYMSDDTLIAGGIAIGSALTGAQAEDQQPAGVGLGSAGFLRVTAGAAGDRAYFHIMTDPNINWPGDGWHWFMEWRQDDTVPGDVTGEIQTGDFLLRDDDGDLYNDGWAVMVHATDYAEWYPWYTTMTFTNCVFSDSGNGLHPHIGSGLGPDQTPSFVKVIDCTFRNLRSEACVFNWVNGYFENCTFDTVGGNYTWFAPLGAEGNWGTGRGIRFQGTDNMDLNQNGPFTMEVYDCEFNHVRESSYLYSGDGCNILYEDGVGLWPGNYGDITIEGCDFDDVGFAVFLRDHSFDAGRQGDVTISDCHVTGCTGGGFHLMLNGLSGTVADCSAIEMPWYGSYNYGFQLGGNTSSEEFQIGAPITCSNCYTDTCPCGFAANDTANVVFEDCLDTNGGSEGQSIYEWLSAGFRSTGKYGASDVVIRRCASYGHKSGGFANVGYAGQGDCGPLLIEDTVFAGFADQGLAFGAYTDQAVIRNCTIADGGGWGISLFWNLHYVVAENCIIANMGDAAVEGDGTGGATLDISYSDVYNCGEEPYVGDAVVNEGPGMIYEDPLFVGGGDYHLTMDSPCIDAGNPSIAPSDFDWEGDTRVINDRVDMGADEYVTIYTEAPVPQPGSDGALFGEPAGGYPGWVWFSIPLTPDCPIGGGCADPSTLLGFDCGGSLFYWDKYGKFTQVYKPPFVTWDLFVGNGYLLQLTGDVPNPSYEGLSPFIPGSFEFKLGKMGWTWIGMPGLTPLTGDDFMTSVMVKYPSYDPGEYRTAAEDYEATPDNWVSWGMSFYNTYLQAPDTFTPYAPFGNRTCYPWLGYRTWVKVGTAGDADDFDQVTLIWPK